MARATILFPIFLLITPYLISKLGAAGYGLWALTGIIASYREFVNFGLTIALVRFVAKEKATENYRAINEYLITGTSSPLKHHHWSMVLEKSSVLLSFSRRHQQQKAGDSGLSLRS